MAAITQPGFGFPGRRRGSFAGKGASVGRPYRAYRVTGRDLARRVSGRNGATYRSAAAATS